MCTPRPQQSAQQVRANVGMFLYVPIAEVVQPGSMSISSCFESTVPNQCRNIPHSNFDTDYI